MTTSRDRGAVIARMTILVATLRDGESRFFDCPTERCNAAVTGKCNACGGLWAWCGCGDNSFDCPCGLNVEEGSPEEAVHLMRRRVSALEEAVRAHRVAHWGDRAVEDEGDRALYALLEDDPETG